MRLFASLHFEWCNNMPFLTLFNRSAPQRSAKSSQSSAPRSAMGQSDGILRFYTDDAPGLKIGPTTVLVSSLLFIAFVVLLHIWGKFRGR